MKNKMLTGLVVSFIIAICVVGVIGYDLLLEMGPPVVTLTIYKIQYAGNTGAPQQQLPDTVIQFTATFEINHGFFNLIQKQAALNFDDFYLTSNNQVLAPIQGYDELTSHGEFIIKSSNMYAWNARYVVEKGVSTCELHYNGTANLNVGYKDTDYPYSGLPIVG
jgi:hypothetical protein